jgi:hypothetical protein
MSVFLETSRSSGCFGEVMTVCDRPIVDAGLKPKIRYNNQGNVAKHEESACFAHTKMFSEK